MCKRFGRTQRIYLATDRATGLAKGFAFVSYYSKQDAENALEKLDRHKFDQLVLKVEWSKLVFIVLFTSGLPKMGSVTLGRFW